MRSLEQEVWSFLVLRSTGAREATVEVSPGSIQLSARLSIQLLPEKPRNESSKTVTPASSHLHKISIYFRTPQTDTKWKNTGTSKEHSQIGNSAIAFWQPLYVFSLKANISMFTLVSPVIWKMDLSPLFQRWGNWREVGWSYFSPVL